MPVLAGVKSIQRGATTMTVPAGAIDQTANVTLNAVVLAKTFVSLNGVVVTNGQATGVAGYARLTSTTNLEVKTSLTHTSVSDTDTVVAWEVVEMH